MKVPVSWLREYVKIDVPVELLAERLTAAGLEVSHIEYLGLPQTFIEGIRFPVSNHLVWDRDKLLLGAIREVKAHPNADRLVLAMVDYGGDQLEQCVTGAPNLFEYKDKGTLPQPLWDGIRQRRRGSVGWAQRRTQAHDPQGKGAARNPQPQYGLLGERTWSLRFARRGHSLPRAAALNRWHILPTRHAAARCARRHPDGSGTHAQSGALLQHLWCGRVKWLHCWTCQFARRPMTC